MYILVKSITDRNIPQAVDGINLARLARECFLNKQNLTIDFAQLIPSPRHFSGIVFTTCRRVWRGIPED